MVRSEGRSQSRLAQACDRCRSKRVKCDGDQPCCSQCASVGIECKISDQRGPRDSSRGYTESLEERVVGLETQTQEIKGLLKKKDNELNALSRLQSSSAKSCEPLEPISVGTSTTIKLRTGLDTTRPLHIEYPLSDKRTSNRWFSSSTAAFLGAFNEKLQESWHVNAMLTPETLLADCLPPPRASTSAPELAMPPRLLSDQYIDLFCREWLPFLPIMPEWTVRRLYKQSLSTSKTKPPKSDILTAQVFLIFEIAACCSVSRPKSETFSYESSWRKVLSFIPPKPHLSSISCYLLAQLSHLLRADYSHLSRDRAYNVSLIHQLGLHKSCTYVGLSSFEAGIRKRLFWCQYVLDRFTSAATGLPLLVHDAGATIDLPAAVNDECISTDLVSPADPDIPMEMSGALALIQLSQIVSKTLRFFYLTPSLSSVSIKILHHLSDLLDRWHEHIPQHLRLQFSDGKIAKSSSQGHSCLLTIGYYYVRSLIHRPNLTHSSAKATVTAEMILGSNSKHIIQIIDLLDQRKMNYIFPLNRQDLLFSAGIPILWQSMDLREGSKLMKGNQESLRLLVTRLSQGSSLASHAFASMVGLAIGSHGSYVQQTIADHNNWHRQYPQHLINNSTTKAQNQPRPIAAHLILTSNTSTRLGSEPQQHATTLVKSTMESSSAGTRDYSCFINTSSTQPDLAANPVFQDAVNPEYGGMHHLDMESEYYLSEYSRSTTLYGSDTPKPTQLLHENSNNRNNNDSWVFVHDSDPSKTDSVRVAGSNSAEYRSYTDEALHHNDMWQSFSGGMQTLYNAGVSTPSSFPENGPMNSYDYVFSQVDDDGESPTNL